ncbi:sugar transferase [Eggerthella lenta]|uniref:sugar transferase n=2 Tax=Eggerthella TaxID=84111 RepID=UPI002B4B9AC5|nr:sugar transferase [Eggerthella lenta]
MLVVETQTTTEDLLEGGTLAAEAGESAFAVSEEEHVAETAGNGLVYRFVKRAFDIAFSLCVVVVGLAPIALLLLIIRLESPGSPIYRQERIGYRGQPLRIFKLRTMVADSDDVEKHLSPEQLAQWRSERKVEDDPRVTRVGRFLRRTSLDELPQFLNVLAGSMSIVGPRPVVAWHISTNFGLVSRKRPKRNPRSCSAASWEYGIRAGLACQTGDFAARRHSETVRRPGSTANPLIGSARPRFRAPGLSFRVW